MAIDAMYKLLISLTTLACLPTALYADDIANFNEVDANICSSLSQTFDGLDVEILEGCIYEAQTIRATHQCPTDVDALTCLYASCDIEQPTTNYTSQQRACLTQHLSDEDAQLIDVAQAIVAEIISALSQTNSD